jgi:hypothetical protein
MERVVTLSVTLLLLTSPLAQADCRTYLGGLTECSGPRGYQSAQRDYQGGVSDSWDNRGNRATIRHHTGGETSVVAPTGVAPSVSPAPLYGQPSVPGREGLNVGSRTVPYQDPFAK